MLESGLIENGRSASLQLDRTAYLIRGWHDAGLPVLEALTAIDMATVLDRTIPEVQAAGATAHEILSGLGARPFWSGSSRR